MYNRRINITYSMILWKRILFLRQRKNERRQIFYETKGVVYFDNFISFLNIHRKILNDILIIIEIISLTLRQEIFISNTNMYRLNIILIIYFKNKILISLFLKLIFNLFSLVFFLLYLLHLTLRSILII